MFLSKFLFILLEQLFSFCPNFIYHKLQIKTTSLTHAYDDNSTVYSKFKASKTPLSI